ARPAVHGGVRAGRRLPDVDAVRGRVPRGLPLLRLAALLRAPPPADVAGGQAPAGAAHAPPLPGRHHRLRRQRAVVGPRLRDGDAPAPPPDDVSGCQPFGSSLSESAPFLAASASSSWRLTWSQSRLRKKASTYSPRPCGVAP